ncbi:MAG: hypothetical protein MMC33_008076 [Icmadophila ericetorum]|nr:hypothetical protein [Icmadophila ericetorum]
MVDPLPINLSEDEIDDILYSARTNDQPFLKSMLSELSTKFKSSQLSILQSAVDLESANTALHMAAANGHTDIIQYILSLPTPSSSCIASSISNEIPFYSLPNASFNTPLHWASLNGHLHSVQLLVDAGGDVTAKNSAGHDALFEAERGGHDEVAGWLAGVIAKKESNQGPDIDMDGMDSKESGPGEEVANPAVADVEGGME